MNNTTISTIKKINNDVDTKTATAVVNTWLIQLTENERIIFFILYLIIFSLSMVANIATLFTTFYRKIRLIQKTLIVSLAVSDIVVCVFFGVTNMVNFSHPMTDFILGSFMCSFIPYMQIVGSVANSLTMTSIALDRYRNIVHPLNKQWDPNIWISIVIILAIWSASAGISYPMFTLTEHYPITVYFLNPNKTPIFLPQTVDLYLCATKQKENHLLFYSIMFALIFLPLMFLFLWLYYKIAQLIWRRRKPAGINAYNNNHSVTLDTSTDSKPPSSVKPSPPVAAHIDRRIKNVVKTSKLHMERKIRTFKIILVIMVVFFVCRMPHWIFTLLRFAKVLSGSKFWIISNSLSLLLIINTTLNPFLYSFLNQTIMYFDKFFMSIGDFISKICCCCCSNTEFDDFEKDNPFSPELYEQRPSQTSSIIPRGPYMDNIINTAKQNHVKFHDVAIIGLYPKENILQNLNCNTY